MKEIRIFTVFLIVLNVGGCSLYEREITSQVSEAKPCWLMTLNTCHAELPIAKENVTRLTVPPGVDTPIGLVERRSELQFIYSHENKFEGDSSDIRYVTLDNEMEHNAVPTFNRFVPESSKKIRDSGSIISESANHYLYYIEADKLFGKPGKTLRAQFVDEQLTQITPLSLQQDIRIIGWPKWYQLHSGEVALVYRAGRSELFFALSKDGIEFGQPIALQTTGAMHALGEFADNTLIYTYQQGFNYSVMQSVFQLSKDKGKTWTDGKEIAPEQLNVHDTTTITRRDGNIDAYYVYPPSEDSQSFSLFRRCIDIDGNLG